ncbi:MAG: PEP-CTERM sorting domain-containing protein [Burkholderiales bacterium]|nr:PEP-CTERM sorting domain-containing protein [Burkholderiales bacterium]
MKTQPIARAALAALAFALSQGASAAILTEDFEGAFPAWESNWFGAQSSARNYYCGGALGCTNRGNNPDGLWISDTNGGTSSPASVVFTATFGASLSSLKLDIASYISTVLSAYDSNNNLIFSQAVANTSGAYTDPGVYASYTINSANGISRFELSGAAKGNISIDNLVATTQDANPVPEPTSLALVLAALVGGTLAKRRRA